MKINSEELKTLTLIVAKGRFANGVFKRRALMLAVEGTVKSLDLWTEEDDELSSSVGRKSSGLASIDWAVSHLDGNGLTHVGHDQWQITQL